MASLIWGGNTYFDEAVAKATSELLPGAAEDVVANLEISDQVRSKQVLPKDAMRSLKKRINHTNPNVQLLALGLTDACIKNGGDHFLVEVASREFMDNLVSIIKQPTVNHDVKQKVLRLVQNWAMAFEQKPSLSYVPTLYKSLKNEGFPFPPYDPLASTAAMIDSQTAPEWIDSDVCLRCRTAFSTFNRKHHCRNCGQVFDQACSSKTMPLPHFGIMEPVRVCDTCYSKVTRNKERADKQAAQAAHHRSNSYAGSTSTSRRHRDDSDLQRAIQLSLQESQSSSSGHHRPGYVPAQPGNWQTSEPPIVNYGSRPPQPQQSSEEEDPELLAAIEASLREANAPRASAPAPLETPTDERARPTMVLPDYDLHPTEMDAIMTFNQTIDDAQAQGPGGLTRQPGINELYQQANGLRPKLALSLDDTGRKEQLLTEMHDKLSEAVKLYDSLLTEQLARPAWRPQSAYGAPARPQTNDPYQQQQPPQHQQYGYAPQQPSGWVSSPPPAPEPAQQWQPATIPQQASVYAPPTVQYASSPPPPPPPQSYVPAPAAPPAQTYAQTYTPAPAQYAAPSPPPASGLTRHNTVSGPIVHRAQTIIAAPPPPSTPFFPAVPAANPQQQQPYATVEHTERKEAQLISFD